jgi:hypothetical protein
MIGRRPLAVSTAAKYSSGFSCYGRLWFGRRLTFVPLGAPYHQVPGLAVNGVDEWSASAGCRRKWA